MEKYVIKDFMSGSQRKFKKVNVTKCGISLEKLVNVSK